MNNYSTTDTICALATAAGQAAIAVIRISGSRAFEVVGKIFTQQSGKTDFKSHKIYLGKIRDGNELIDEVLVSFFKNPNSYTGEDVVEISCHGSVFIQQKILQLISSNGVRQALPGEFTQRAFLNGKLDLSQAEAVADLISSETKASHQIALQQMRGGFSNEIKELRSSLIHFASLLELELDFAEEDVEFADRKKLAELVRNSKSKIEHLLKSFELGNVLKNGVPVVIAGKPNVGKSTLLNVLLNEERAIVSEVAGTTRDVIEDEITFDGIKFRFIDTAGLRQTENVIENIGIKKAFDKINAASMLIFLFDARETSVAELKTGIDEILSKNPALKIIPAANKTDLLSDSELKNYSSLENFISLSAKNKTGIDLLKKHLLQLTDAGNFQSQNLVTNARHASGLQKANQSLQNFIDGLNSGLSNDLLASEIRYALNALGEITGEITTDDLLENIFSKFCIGK